MPRWNVSMLPGSTLKSGRPRSSQLLMRITYGVWGYPLKWTGMSKARLVLRYQTCSSYENEAFLLVEATVCCRFCYSSEEKVIVTNITSRVPILVPLSDISTHKKIGIRYCHVITFWNSIGASKFLAAEVTVYSYQAISPTAWEQGLTFSGDWSRNYLSRVGVVYERGVCQWEGQ